ncbi:MAG: hypothetical protein LQ341_005291, partial [Variospora aurantia]
KFASNPKYQEIVTVISRFHSVETPVLDVPIPLIVHPRSYRRTYPAKSQSAPYIQQILNLGALIVSKTKLCAFAQWEEPMEAIEYTFPWSARADGFQLSGGSSNGSGAAVAVYDWLDIT